MCCDCMLTTLGVPSSSDVVGQPYEGREEKAREAGFFFSAPTSRYESTGEAWEHRHLGFRGRRKGNAGLWSGRPCGC